MLSKEEVKQIFFYVTSEDPNGIYAKDVDVVEYAKKIEAVLAFEPFAEATLLLTTMRTDLKVPQNTTIGIKELIEKRN